MHPGAHTGAPLQPKYSNLWHVHDLVGADLCVGPDRSGSTRQALLLCYAQGAHTGAPLQPKYSNLWYVHDP